MNFSFGIPAMAGAIAPVAAKFFSDKVDQAQKVVQANPEGYADLGTANALVNYLSGVSAQNTAKSQEMAREQMAFQRESQAVAMAYNAAEAQKNRDWQELMSNTAHQREMADLQAAGLNPVLSANGGASVGSGATASSVGSQGSSGSVDTSVSGAIGSILGSLFNSMASMRNQEVSAKAAIDIAQKQADTSLALGALQAQTSKYVADSSSDSSRYTANMHYAGTKYSSDSSLAGTMYAADSSKSAALATSANAYNAAIQAAQISSATSKAISDAQIAAGFEKQQNEQDYDAWKGWNQAGMSGVFNAGVALANGLFNGNRFLKSEDMPYNILPPSKRKK